MPFSDEPNVACKLSGLVTEAVWKSAGGPWMRRPRRPEGLHRLCADQAASSSVIGLHAASHHLSSPVGRLAIHAGQQMTRTCVAEHLV